MAAPLDREGVVADMAGFPGRLADAVRGARDRPVSAGEWSRAAVVRHLIAVEVDVHQARLHDLATTDDPHWDWAEPGPWPGEPQRTLFELLDRFAEQRAATLKTVRALDEAAWSRTGTHSRLGRWDVAGLLRNAVDHDTEHLPGISQRG